MVPWGQGVQKPWLKQNQPYRAQGFGFPGAGGGFPVGVGCGGAGGYAKGGWGKGGGWSKGWGGGGKGGGGGWNQNKRPPPTVPENFQVDPNMRYFGSVLMYNKFRGFGFVTPSVPGTVPTDKVFVHWKQVQSDDRYPFLTQGLEVEFSLMLAKEWKTGGSTLRATNVTLVGGMSVALQDELDAGEKHFVGGQHLRYTGMLKFYSPRHQFGYIVMDQGYDVDASVPNEMRVDLEEVNAAGQQPVHMQNIAVEFGIFQNEKGQYKGYNMTLPGGHPLTRDALENRISMGGNAYRGQVAMWNWRIGFGFIRPDPSVVLPPKVTAKLAEQAQAARQRGKNISEDRMLYFRTADITPGISIVQHMQVTFQVYVDDKGAGASEISA